MAGSPHVGGCGGFDSSLMVVVYPVKVITLSWQDTVAGWILVGWKMQLQ